MPWKEMSVMEQKEEFILLWKSGKYSITELSEMFTISRPTAYKYIKRYEKYGLPGLFELSVSIGAKLQERGCGHFLGLNYAEFCKSQRYSTGLRPFKESLIRFSLYH